MNEVRVRFAPSPTGYLHVGGARTALFNWLFARHHGGRFILRIEDTDLARSTEESVTGILEGMRWLGLDWDEGPQCGGEYGPYFQTERLDLYKEYAEKLIAAGRAYYCYCTPEEVDEMREKARQEGRDPKYDGRCWNLSEEKRQEFIAAGRKPVIRFRAKTEGKTTVRDLVRGDVSFDNSVLDDFVIFKSDGVPTYNFAVVIDDALMKISHVIRGEDHLSNTPKQIQLYEALGLEVPQFAHIPMILGPDKKRLSKRHGATSVTQYRDQGYLPEAMVNYLALLGWSFDDKQTLFSVPELIEKFSLDRVSKNPAVFDLEKLEWMNGVYIRELAPQQLLEKAVPFWQQAGLLTAEEAEADKDRLLQIIQEMQPRIKTLQELPEATKYFFTDDFEYDEKAVRKFFKHDYVLELFDYLEKEFAALDEFSQDTLKPVFNTAMEKFDKKLGKIMQPLRVAVTGTRVSPGMYETLGILGKETTLRRIGQARELTRKVQAELENQ